MINQTNMTRLVVVSNALAELNQTVIFVGGAVVGAYCNSNLRQEERPTDDVDVVVEILSRGDYAALEERLYQIGFQPDSNSPVICRHRYQGITVDIMPSKSGILGFSNHWFQEGINNINSFELDKETIIQVLETAYFLASKMEALKSERKGSDFRSNSDFEDIVYLFDNRTTFPSDILDADEAVRSYLTQEISVLLNRPNIYEEVASNLESSGRNERRARIIGIWQQIAEM